MACRPAALRAGARGSGYLLANHYSLVTVLSAQSVITTVAGNGRVLRGEGGPASLAALGELQGEEHWAMVVYFAFMDVKQVIEDFQDYLAPKLDTYEQAIYLYLFRHSRLQGKDEIVTGFVSARLRMAFGVGEKGKPMSKNTCYEKLQSLESKGCINIVDKERDGTGIRLLLPSEISGLIPQEQPIQELTLDELDFFNVPENRPAILRREGNKCFYCFRALNSNNYVIEHVTSRPEGNNTYRNVVAACRDCNNRKGNLSADEFLRGLYRRGYLSATDFEARSDALTQLRSGDLKPSFP